MAGADRSKAARTALQLIGRAAAAFYARSVLVTLCGGVGAARMLSGLVRVVPPSSITAIVNIGDDTILHGLHISPDLDTITYTLAGMDNRETGWGVAGESWTVMEELAQLGGESWFRLGDRDLATHLFRTERLRAGATLSEVTAAIAARRHVDVHLLPVTDDPVRTMLTLAEATDLGPPGTEVGFQDYFVRLHHEVAVRTVRFAGAEVGSTGPRRARGADPGRADRGLPVKSDRLDRPTAGRSRRAGGPDAAPGRHRRGVADHRRRGAEGSGRPADEPSWGPSHRSSAWPASTPPGSAPS